MCSGLSHQEGSSHNVSVTDTLLGLCSCCSLSGMLCKTCLNVTSLSRSLVGLTTLSSSATPLCRCLHCAPRCTVHWAALHTPLPSLHPLSAQSSRTAAGGSWGGSATAEGRTSPSSGSYSAVGPDQGWPPGTAGRRAGQRGSRHRQSGRNSRSGERAGQGKAGRGTPSGQWQANPSGRLLLTLLP